VQSETTADHDTGSISLNPACGGKPYHIKCRSLIATVMMAFVFHHAVSHQDVPKDGDEALDYMII
jgi:hypothetical protein